MITRIILNNFMSHVHTEVDLAEVQTVTGANDSGKSAFIFALYWVVAQVGNDSVIYNKAKTPAECSVRVESDRGYVVKTRKKGGNTQYEINGQFWHKAEIPDEVFEVLEICRSSITESYINFYFQHDGLFLLSENAGSAMAIMGKLIDADVLVAANKKIQKNARLLKIEEADAKEKAKALSNSLQLLSGLDGCRDTHTRVSSKFKKHKESCDKLSALRKALSVLISSGEILRHSKDVCTVLESLPRVPYSRAEEITKLKENTHKLQKTDSFRAFSAAKVNILSALPSTVSSRKRIAVLSKVENLYNGLSKSMKNKLQYAKVVNILHKLEKQIKNVTKLSHDLDTIKKLDASCKNIAKSNNILKVCKYKIKLLDDILISNVILYDSSSANYTALSNMQNACVAIKDAAYSLEKAKESLNNTLSDLETAKEEKKSFELALGGVCPFCHHLLEDEGENTK